MRLIHFSPRPIYVVDSTKQGSRESGIGKPNGLWVSDESDQGWADYCVTNDVFDLRKGVAYEIVLDEGHEVLFLRTPKEIDAFTRRFGSKRETASCYAFNMITAIDWHTVAKHYQGVIITPYQYARRLEPGTIWYYGWDCASGCIWDRTAIAALHDADLDALLRDHEYRQHGRALG